MALDSEELRKALEAAQIELYGVSDHEIKIAERVRLHLMDAGLRISLTFDRVEFLARAQQADHPDQSAATLLESVRRAIGATAKEHGFSELHAESNSIRDPSNEGIVLDVWHEITYSKRVSTIGETVADVQWVLKQERYVP